MTRYNQTWDRFTDTSVFTTYDDVPGVYRKNHVTVENGKLRFDCNADGGWGGWFGPSRALYGEFSIGLQGFGGDNRTGMVVFLWPSSDIWAEGEMDGPEGAFRGETVKVFHHSMTPGREGEADFADYGVDWSQRNLFKTRWTPTEAEYTVNGRVVKNVRHDIPTKPHRYTFQSKPQNGSAPAYALVDTFSIRTS